LRRSVICPVRDYDEVWEQERQMTSDGIGLRVGPITWSRASFMIDDDGIRRYERPAYA
jgi:hypothetical protein